MKRFLAILILVATFVTVVSCNKKTDDEKEAGTTTVTTTADKNDKTDEEVEEVKAKTFKSDGLTITLTEDFAKANQPGFTVCYDSASVAVLALKESFSLQEGVEDWSLSYYASLIQTVNAAYSPTTPKKVGDYMVMEHTFYNPATQITYHYYTCMYKGSDAFWTIQFACDVNEVDQHKADIMKWADSIRV